MAASDFNRRAEVDALLELDKTKLGNFWRYKLEGLDTKQIAEREGDATSGWVSNYNLLLQVLREGHIPESPSSARQGASRIRQWLKIKAMSPELRIAFQNQESVLSSRAEDRQAQDKEIAEAIQVSKRAEQTGIPGIYVYTLPHYLKYPVEPTTGKTLLKVGHSSKDAYYRADVQGRLTSLPEDPILLRIYPVAASAVVEREFHDWLRDADHASSRARRGGSEWFVTSTKFLDRIAKAKNLEVIEVNKFETDDE